MYYGGGELQLPILRVQMGEWRHDAACRDMDPELFFPGTGGRIAGRKALAVCARCPVRTDCLDWALKAPEKDGVWGGTTARQRRDGKMYRPVCRDCAAVVVQTRGSYCDQCRALARVKMWKKAQADARRRAS